MKIMKLMMASLIPASLLFLSANASADEGLDLAKKSGCMACHSIDKTIVGPAWKLVSEKYKDTEGAHDMLVKSIMTGSSGKWGSKVHMKAQKNVSEESVGKLVDYILSLSAVKE